MSGNPYRRQGGMPPKNGQSGSGNGYYRMNNYNNYNSGRGGYNRHNSYNNRGGHYNGYGYNSGQYDPRHNNSYHSQHHHHHQYNNNSRYHQYNNHNNNINSNHINSTSSRSPFAVLKSNSPLHKQQEQPTNFSNNKNFETTRDHSATPPPKTENAVVTKASHPLSGKNNDVETSKNVHSPVQSLSNLNLNSNSHLNSALLNNSKPYSNEVKTNTIKSGSNDNMEKKSSVDSVKKGAISENVHVEQLKSSSIEPNKKENSASGENKIVPELVESKIVEDNNNTIKADKRKDYKEETESNESQIGKSLKETNEKKPEKLKEKISQDKENSDEDEPIQARHRNKSSDVILPADDSEAETDIEDSIPVPSRKTRRLHRLLQPTTTEGEETTIAPPKRQSSKKRTASNASNSNSTTPSNSNSRASRSQSPKQRKTSRVGRDASGRTLLQRMCAKGNLDEAKRLIEEGQNINDADFAGITPLHEAALEGHYEITELLLDNGANIDVQSGQMDKDTPLIDAVSNLHLNVVQLLLKRGANPAIQNAQGENALDALEATMKEYDENDVDILDDYKNIKKLLAEYSKSFPQDTTSSQYTKKSERSNLLFREDNQYSYASLKKGGSNSLQERISANDVTFVLNYVSSMNGKKIPPEALLLASNLGFPDIASLLIAFGADINFKDKNNGMTPLMLSVGKGHLEMVKLLLSNQADVSLKDNKGRTVVDILKENGLDDTEEFRLLSSKISDISASAAVTDLDNVDNLSKMEIDENSSLSKDTVIGKVEGLNDKSGSSNDTFDEKHKKVKTKKRKASEPDQQVKKNVSEGKEKVNTEIDQHVSKKPKISEEKRTVLETSSSSPTTSKKHSSTAATKPNKKSDDGSEERKPVPAPPTAMELEAQRLKEVETQKAREALEQQRLERKKLKQQEIAKRIDAFEKRREEEQKAAERENLAKKRKEEEEQNKLLKEQEENRKKKEIEFEQEKRKLVRSYYPSGLRNAIFNGKLIKENIENFLPLYVFNIGNDEYVADLQLNLLLGIENLYSMYPHLHKRKAKDEEKTVLWNFLWPLIGSFTNVGDKSINEVQKIYEKEGDNFKELIISWIRLDEFSELIKNEGFEIVQECIQRIGICHAALSNRNTNNSMISDNMVSSFESTTSKTINGVGNNLVIDLEASAKDNYTDIPIRFGKKARSALKMLNKSLW